MIDSGEQKSSASVPSAWGFRIMVLIALVLFVGAVFFIRSNSHRSTSATLATGETSEQAAQIEDQPQAEESFAEADATGQAPADAPSTDQQMTPPPGMMDGRGGMGYHAPGMQPPPPSMTGAMQMPLEVAPANPGAMQPHTTGPMFQNGQPMQPMMGYGYGPSGPYYWFIVPIPQIPGTVQPVYPGAAVPNGYDVPPQPGYGSSMDEEQPDPDEQEEGEQPY